MKKEFMKKFMIHFWYSNTIQMNRFIISYRFMFIALIVESVPERIQII